MRMDIKLNRLQVTSFTFFIALGVLFNCGENKEKQIQTTSNIITKNEVQTIIGRGNCIECHQREYELWTGSDHDLAMDEANEKTVLGDFNNVEFTHFGVMSRFYKKADKYLVNTEGPDGNYHDYEIKYVFGFKPLQQYLIEFPNGHYQMLPFCWDTRAVEDGGQCWFHIYPDERIAPNDELYWTNMNQNWNYMCAECHSTNVKKNYHLESRSYHTTWSEVDVSCEACHGPGYEHSAWAKAKENGRRADAYKNMGLIVRLKDPAKGTWIFDMETGNAARTTPPKNKIQIEVCGRCHSRRATISEDYQYSLLMDTHRLQLLTENYYYADGQILEEVYVYGSFLQSKMYKKGVVCSDCHEPHSGKIYAQGNALCYRCHLYEKFGVKSHHFHNPDSSGASCVECHMSERIYMVVDPRRDHSIRIPRPDLSLKLESPNACNKCHSDKSVKWAVEYMVKWYGNEIQEQHHYGETVFSALNELPGAGKGLLNLIGDTAQSNIVRATALTILNRYSTPDIIETISTALQHSDPLIRFGALQAFGALQPGERFNLAKHLLVDPVRSIRIQAVNELLDVPQSALSSAERGMLNRAIQEYIQVQRFNGERAGSHLNLGILYFRQGYPDRAEQAFKTAIALEPYFVYSYINLSDLYRGQGLNDEGEKILREALVISPNSADLHYALGLALVRQKRTEEALAEIEKAVSLRPDDPNLNYVWAISLNSVGKTEEAISILENALKLRPTNRDLLFALTTINRDKGDFERALMYAQELVDYWPAEPSYQHLKEQIHSQLMKL